FVAIDQKDIGKVALRLYSIKINSALCECLFSQMGWFHNPKRTHLKLQTIFRMTQVTAKMAWEDHLNNAEEVRKTVIANYITGSNDSKASSSNQSESNIKPSNKTNALNLSENEHIPLFDDIEMPNNDDSDTNDYNSDDCDSDDCTNEENENGKSVIGEWTQEDENEEPEELTTTSYNTINLHKNHPAEHQESKIELRYLFTCTLSQPSFVHTLQQDVE
ncbi:19107_t:CDS:2, partial [Dentiscutata erythropus]